MAIKSNAMIMAFAYSFLFSVIICAINFIGSSNAQRSPESTSSSSSYNRSYSYSTSTSGNRYPASSSVHSSSSISSSISPSLLPSSRFRSFECRYDVLPQRSEVVPHGVVFTGTVHEIRQDGGNSGSDNEYSATVTVRRVFFGPRSLRKSRVTVTGFGDRSRGWCHSNVRPGDTWLFVLVPITYPDYFRLNASLIRMNLAALEKMEGIIADAPYRRLTSVEEFPCEKKYCKNNGICIEDKYSPEGTKCECLSYCKQNYAPVCASNNETYTNECEVRLKSCYAGKNWFIKSLTACQNVASPYSSYGRSSSSVSSAPPLSSSFSSTSGRHYSSSPSSSSPSGSSSYSYSYRTSDSRSPASSSSQSLPLLPPPPYSPRDQNRPDTSRSYSRTVTTNTITRSYSS